MLASRLADNLSDNAKTVAAVLSLSEVPLATDEIREVVSGSLGLTPPAIAAAIRELTCWGVVQHIHDGSISVHDVVRTAWSSVASSIDESVSDKALVLLSEQILTSLQSRWDFARQRYYLHLLIRTGQTEELLTLASNESEAFTELGYVDEVKSEIEAISSSSTCCPRDRFWATDTLAFWACQSSDNDEFERCFKLLQELAEALGNEKREAFALLLKRLWQCALANDLSKASELYSEGLSVFSDAPEMLRILEYNYALLQYKLGLFDPAASSAFKLAMEYYDLLDLDFEDIIVNSRTNIMAALNRAGTDIRDAKRLANCLDLFAAAMNAMGQYSRLARIHAVKLYSISLSVSSAVRVGQDAVDEILSMTKDPWAARRFIESVLLPIVKDFKLVDNVIPVRAQHAVVLAYCGESKEALAEMERLEQFKTNDPTLVAELANQRKLIAAIVSGEMQLAPSTTGEPQGLPKQRYFGRKVGRNEKCPCGFRQEVQEVLPRPVKHAWMEYLVYDREALVVETRVPTVVKEPEE